jgi:hypothetical protein
MRTLLLLVALLLAAPAAGEEFTVLSYNTHGLSAWVAGDDPATRFPIIGEKSNAYDVALLQEDFAHHASLLLGARQPIVERGNPSRFGRWCPICTGSGLTILSRWNRESLLELVSRGYGHCAGWIGGANDCLASKGFQRVRLRLPGGAALDFVNTHLDAADPEDVARRDAFTRSLGLADSGARGSDHWPALDYIFYRSGGGLELEVVEAGEDTSFVHEDAPLSDHPAIFARFRTRQARRGGGEPRAQ